MSFRIYIYVFTALVMVGCRGEMPIIDAEQNAIDHPRQLDGVDDIKGFYLINQGNMGSNKASIDYFDYLSGVYYLNIYPSRNPQIVKELGDVGNDIGVYGSKLYAVINCSNYIEVMDAASGRHISEIHIDNCRYITFSEGYAYVSSYAGPVQMNPESRRGKVLEIDTLTLQVTREVTVGYQPEQMVINDGKLYVANSGGYRYPLYDRTVSVIDLSDMRVIKNIDVAPNLCQMQLDRRGYIYVQSRGNYSDVSSNVYVLDSNSNQVVGHLDIDAQCMTLSGDKLYIISGDGRYGSMSQYISYDVTMKKVSSYNFIYDKIAQTIKTPYFISVNEQTGEIYIGDAGDYVTPGTLYCFNNDGSPRWKVTTGDVPAAMAFSTIRYE